jgi:hypothetical protein
MDSFTVTDLQKLPDIEPFSRCYKVGLARCQVTCRPETCMYTCGQLSCGHTVGVQADVAVSSFAPDASTSRIDCPA